VLSRLLSITAMWTGIVVAYAAPKLPVSFDIMAAATGHRGRIHVFPALARPQVLLADTDDHELLVAVGRARRGVVTEIDHDRRRCRASVVSCGAACEALDLNAPVAGHFG
jgi:hypothetical protein